MTKKLIHFFVALFGLVAEIRQDPGRFGKKFLRLLTPLFGVLLFALMLWVLYQQLAGHHLRDILKNMERTPWSHRLLALAFTFLAYAVLPGYDLLGMRYIARKVPFLRVMLVSVLSYVFSNNVGLFGLSGGAVRLRFYTAWGLSAGEVFKLVAFTAFSFWMGLLSVAGVMFLLEPLALPKAPYVPQISVRPVGAVFSVVVVAYLLVCAVRKKPVRVWNWELAFPSFRLALGQLVIGGVDWMLAAAPLYALLPDGHKVNFPTFVTIFLLAQVVALISHVPGGLGVFETIMVLMLKPGIKPEVAIGILLVYRVIYYLLPLVLGAVALGGYELVQRREVVQPLGQMYARWAAVLVPDVLAFLTFIGGVVLVFSGATPAMEHRIGWLGNLVPLPVIEVSHFLGSLAGIALILLARGLQKRFDAAYWLSAVLLVVGIAASLGKGLDWEEACILTVFLAVLLPCRREFYRRTSLFSEWFSPAWVTGICVVLLAMFWLTMFSHRYNTYSTQLWWQFELTDSAPRSIRAAVGVSALALIVAGGLLLRPAPRRHAVPNPEEVDQARALAERSPSTYGYLALLGDKSLMFNEKRTAFMMYSVRGGSWIAMGDPVGPPEAIKELAWEFHERCDRAGGQTVFYQVQPANLHIYVDLGLSFIKLGEEGRVPLAGFSLQGRARKNLRHMLNKAKEAGYSFRMVPTTEIAALMPELRAISDAWLTTRNLREKGFSLGFFDEAYLARFPMALVEQNGKVVAFANLWPGGERAELSIDLMRHLPDASNGVMDMLFVELMLWGAAEGYKWFNLGMAPMSGLDDSSLAPLWSRFGAMIFQHGENFYNFQGLRRYKEKFDPIWEPRYLASPGGLALPRILAEVTTLISKGTRGKKEGKGEKVDGDSILLPT